MTTAPTTNPLTESEIEELEKVLAESTPGPWDYETSGCEVYSGSDQSSVGMTLSPFNAAVIVALRNIAPRLIAGWRAANERAIRWETLTFERDCDNDYSEAQLAVANAKIAELEKRYADVMHALHGTKPRNEAEANDPAEQAW